MLMSARLRQQLTETMGRLRALATTAGERLFTEAEQKTFDDLTAQADRLGAEVRQHEQREAVLRGQEAPGVRAVIDGEGRRHAVLRGGPQLDRMADRHRSLSRELAAQFSVGALVRGIATGRWDDPVGGGGTRDLLQRAMGETVASAGGFTVPAPLSAMWLDLARQAAIMNAAGCITVPMESQTLRIAALASDIVPAFRKELTPFARSEATFRAIDLRARSAGVITEASLELLADSPNASQMIETSLVTGMALAMDAAMLSGDGDVTGTLDNPVGILSWPGIPATAAIGDVEDYSPWLAAMNSIETFNEMPMAVVDRPATMYALANLKTGIGFSDGTTTWLDKTPLVPPAPYVALGKHRSNSVPAGTSVVGNFAMSGWGMREAITIEATRLSDTALSTGSVQIRAMHRFDTFVLRTGAFHILSGITFP